MVQDEGVLHCNSAPEGVFKSTYKVVENLRI